MSGCHIFNRKRVPAYLGLVCCAFLMMLAVGCGDKSTPSVSPDMITSDSAETGSVTLSIQWQTDSDAVYSADALIRQAIDNCTDAGVAYITAEVYDEANNPIASGGPWSCDDRGGRIERIPAGTNRNIAVLGWDTNRENILYQGHTDTGIGITAGEITDAGTIVAHSFVPSGLEATTSSNSRISLVWSDFGGDYDVSGYRIYRDGIAIATSDTSSHEDDNLNPGIQYCYTIAAYDVFGNESGPCIASCATTQPSEDDVDNDGDGYSEIQGDCDDANADINPDAAETCNGVDDNCAGGIDEGLSTDADGDGHYTPSSCAIPADDCDDTSGTVYLGATEVCGDGIDQDCNGEDLSCDTVDNDGDGYSEIQGDCDDANADVNPGATEICNGINDNCAGGIDEGLSTDADGDRHYTPGSCLTPADDCDDTRESVHPRASETCNGIDDNCTDGIDEGLSRATTCGVGACTDNTGTATCSAGVWMNDTCDPLAGSTTETCDSVDNDCDGSVDEGLSRATTCGAGACANNTGTATCTAGNWNDTCDPLAGATVETCDNVDNDCDGPVDEDVQSTFYYDSDGDGFGDADNPTQACTAPYRYVDNSLDCRDDLPDVHPDVMEVCHDGVDNNCNGEIDERCAIDVNIDRDFQYVAQGFPMGLSVGQTAASALRSRPYEDLTEPSYYDLYGEFFERHYGYLTMGNSQDNIVSFVIIEIQGYLTPNRYELFIDSNNNENLRDDGGPHSNQGTLRLATLVSLNAAVIDDSGNTITRPYQLWIWLSDTSAVWFYARCHYTGEIRIGGELYTAVAFERRNHDALYRESGLYIDLNGNDQLDEETENFLDQSMVTVNGRQYELLLNYR